MRDMTKINVKWLRPGYTDSIMEYHPHCFAFENSLKEIRSHALQKIQSSCLLQLPFSLRTDLERQHNLVLTHQKKSFHMLKCGQGLINMLKNWIQKHSSGFITELGNVFYFPNIKYDLNEAMAYHCKKN